MIPCIDSEATTFIKVAEVWVPEGDRLVLADGDYGELEAFATASQASGFTCGEGLPGKAWQQGRPVVLKHFDGSYFKRIEAAEEAGLTSAVAVPVFAESTLKAVLVLLCGTDTHHHGAIEVWQDDGERLTLDDGYYGSATRFESASRTVSFAHGQGLPGAVLAANTPLMMRDIARSSNFMRSAQAAAIGLKTGLGIPVPTASGDIAVVTLLSASDTPIAHRFEIWDARPERVGATRSAQLIDGLCERHGALWPQQNPPIDPPMAHVWKGPIGQVLGTGLPHVKNNGAGLPAGYTSMVALPIHQEADLAYVIAWYL
ncbi:MAG: GAF domain-containing protein [Granulosicoccus sp.]|nr:GAF domain-containing protein [Granulosicoccus sp.]